MMSGHGANPIFFNKKNKALANPQPTTSDDISFLSYHPPPPTIPPQSGRHMCITPKKNVLTFCLHKVLMKYLVSIRKSSI